MYNVRFNHKFVCNCCWVYCVWLIYYRYPLPIKIDFWPLTGYTARKIHMHIPRWYEVVPYINHCELGLAVRYLGSWCYVLWNKNKLPLSKVSSFVRFTGSTDLGNREYLPHHSLSPKRATKNRWPNFRFGFYEQKSIFSFSETDSMNP